MASIEDPLTRVALNGTYYRPAGLHYSQRTPYAHIVICDLCGLRGITACIGLESSDLCMHCTQNLLDRHEQASTINRNVHEHARLFENLPRAKFQSQHAGFLSTGTDD
jgi:hypothetical protein